jgi:protein O-mannosyl-transferase
MTAEAIAAPPAEPQTELPTEPAPVAPADPTRWPKAIPLLVLAGLLAYANSFTKAFVFDDFSAILNNPHIAQFPDLSWQGRPLIRLSLWVNYKLSGFNPTTYHALNLAVHILAGLTLYGLVRRTLLRPRFAGRYDTTAPKLAFAVALLWLVHPLQTQSVTYVIQRCESMMGLFYLFSLYAWLRGATGGCRCWYALSVASFGLSFACKEVAVTLPAVLLLFDRVFLAASWRELIRSRWAAYLAVAAIGAAVMFPTVATATGGGHEGGVGFTISSSTPYQYLLTQSGVILHYVRLAVWPRGQAVDYLDWPIAKSLGEVAVPFAVVAGLFLASVVLLFKRPAIGFVGMWFFLILVPSSSIMPIIDPAFEHRMYLSLAAIAVGVVLGGHALIGRTRWPDPAKVRLGSAAVGLVALVLMALTFARNESYQSLRTALERNIEVRPNNPRPMSSLAAVYLSTGELEKAEAIIQRAEALQSGFNVGPIQMRAAYNARTGKLDDATQGYLRLVNGPFNPTSSPSQFKNLAWILIARGRGPDAATVLRKLLENRPDVAEDYLQLAAAELLSGHEAEARVAATEATRLDPRGAKLMGMEARFTVLAADPSTAALNKPMALWQAAAACLADGDRDPLLLDTLAMAWAWHGQYPKALGVVQGRQTGSAPGKTGEAVTARGDDSSAEPRKLGA